MKTLITGGTGLPGSELFTKLADAAVSSRDSARTSRKLGGPRAVRWDRATESAWCACASASSSQRVLPRVAERTGYAFNHTGLEGALAALMAALQRSAA